MKIFKGSEVDEYLEYLRTSKWSKGENSEVAKRTFWQLDDFDFDAVIVIEGDVHLKTMTNKWRPDIEYSSPWDELLTPEATGLSSELDGRHNLLVIDGNVTAESHISLSERCLIITGDLTCSSLYVDGESLFCQFGKCKARFIHSSYNGTCSAIREAETDYVVLSADEMLSIFNVSKELLCFDECLVALKENDLLKKEIYSPEEEEDEDEALGRFLKTIEKDENPFKGDLSFEEVKKLLQKHLIGTGKQVHFL